MAPISEPLQKTAYTKKLKELKTNMHGHLQTGEKKIFVVLENQLGTGTAIHLSDSGFILSSLKVSLAGAVP